MEKELIQNTIKDPQNFKYLVQYYIENNINSLNLDLSEVIINRNIYNLKYLLTYYLHFNIKELDHNLSKTCLSKHYDIMPLLNEYYIKFDKDKIDINLYETIILDNSEFIIYLIYYCLHFKKNLISENLISKIELKSLQNIIDYFILISDEEKTDYLRNRFLNINVENFINDNKIKYNKKEYQNKLVEINPLYLKYVDKIFDDEIIIKAISKNILCSCFITEYNNNILKNIKIENSNLQKESFNLTSGKDNLNLIKFLNDYLEFKEIV